MQSDTVVLLSIWSTVLISALFESFVEINAMASSGSTLEVLLLVFATNIISGLAATYLMAAVLIFRKEAEQKGN